MAGLIFVGIELVFVIISVYRRVQLELVDVSLWS